MARGETNDLAEELLIDLAEDFRGQDREFVGTLGIVEPSENLFEHLVVDLQTGSQIVGRFGSILFLMEVK